MLSHQLAPLSQFLSSKRENWLPQLEYETVTEKSQNIKKFKGQKAKLAEASLDAPQPARECEGAHRWKGIPWGALVPLMKRHTSSAPAWAPWGLRPGGRRLPALHCPFRDLRGPWVLTVKFNIHLIPPGGHSRWRAGGSAVSRGRALTLCFTFWPEWIPRTQQRHRVWVPRDRQRPPGAYVLLPTFLLAASVLYHHPEWEW